MLQYAYLLLGLSMETFLITHQLQRYILLVLVIVRFDHLWKNKRVERLRLFLSHLPKRAFADDFQHFIAIR